MKTRTLRVEEYAALMAWELLDARSQDQAKQIIEEVRKTIAQQEYWSRNERQKFWKELRTRLESVKPPPGAVDDMPVVNELLALVVRGEGQSILQFK